MKPRRSITKSLILILILGFLAFLYIGVQGAAIALPLPSSATAQTQLSDPSGTSDLSGEILLTETPQGLRIEASVSGAPEGSHGFHIHANGSCADAGNAAGGHYNPDNVKHGLLINDGFATAHAGDLGNIVIDADGNGSFEATIPGLSVSDGSYSVANHAVILHANPDDFSQPTGNAGGRIGCGVLIPNA